LFYTAYYKAPHLFSRWHKVKNVKGDFTADKNGPFLPYRVLVLADETRLEVPYSYIIRFLPDRFASIHAKMETEAGQKIPVKQ